MYLLTKSTQALSFLYYIHDNMRQNLTNFFTEVASEVASELPPSITTTDITLSKRANNITF